MKKRLILFDTCNFRDYPVGGQVTSIKNFLRYITEIHQENIGDILLVGVSTINEDVGKVKIIELHGVQFNFLAVTLANTDQNAVKKSLRLEYVKGLFKYKKLIHLTKSDCAYIHTPEAFYFVKMVAGRCATFVFSHGTYMDMWKRVRFFKKIPLIPFVFQQYLVYVIKKCNGIFVLEEETEIAYKKYNKNVTHVGNSIISRDFIVHKPDFEKLRFVYAGRLSAVKNIAPIIEAVKKYPNDCVLELLGAGEKMNELQAISNSRIHFRGAVTPDIVKEYFESCDILIMNSTFEGIPMTILEAISYSLPVITTDVGGIKEVLRYGEDSEVTDGTSESILKAIEKIKLNYEEYSRNAHNRSLDFDYKKVNGIIFDQLNTALDWE